jgi:hypothetical protein
LQKSDPSPRFLANGEARSTVDAEGLRKRLTETSTDVRSLHIHLETIDVEAAGFSDPKDFALTNGPRSS